MKTAWSERQLRTPNGLKADGPLAAQFQSFNKGLGNGGFWAGSGKAAFISLSGLSGQRLLTESQAGALENGLEKPLLA